MSYNTGGFEIHYHALYVEDYSARPDFRKLSHLLSIENASYADVQFSPGIVG